MITSRRSTASSMAVLSVIFSLCAGDAAAQAVPCNTTAELAPLRNKFICPVAGGGAVRKAADACATAGGRLKSLRKNGKLHNALDINAQEGTSVVASKPGRVDIQRKIGELWARP